MAQFSTLGAVISVGMQLRTFEGWSLEESRSEDSSSFTRLFKMRYFVVNLTEAYPWDKSLTTSATKRASGLCF
jgi:hypothetical protein